jgi:hypothetical protein
MRSSIALAIALIAVIAPTLLAHDLFIKLSNYFPAPRQRVVVPVLNGTFSTSENAVTHDRLRDISLVSGGSRVRLDSTAWGESRDKKSSRITIQVGSSGTYVLGASILPRVLAFDKAKDFNAYLAEEGLADVLEARKHSGELEKAPRERYAKHVKAIFQVGEIRSSDFSRALGYAAEIVPQQNPYSLSVGGDLTVKCLLGDSPASGVAVIAGGRTTRGARMAEQKTRADSNGLANVKLTSSGVWYVKFIKMERRSADSVDYRSEWATLTFAVK